MRNGLDSGELPGSYIGGEGAVGSWPEDLNIPSVFSIFPPLLPLLFCSTKRNLTDGDLCTSCTAAGGRRFEENELNRRPIGGGRGGSG